MSPEPRSRAPARRGRVLTVACLLGLLAVPAAAKQEDALYAKLYPDLIVNLRTSGKARFVLLAATVRAEDTDGLDAVQQHMPALRHHLILLLSQKRPEELLDPAAKEATRGEALARVNEFLEQETGRASVAEVFFTDLIVE